MFKGLHVCDQGIGAVSAVLWTFYQTVVGKRVPSQKAKLLIFQSNYVPFLTYDHELWLVIETTTAQIQVAKINFFRSALDIRLGNQTSGGTSK